MSYSASTDFLGLLRLVGSTLRSERMPGLDWLIAALNRAGLFTLYVGQVAPTVNQATTVWLQPAVPSWTAEGTLYLWNPAALAYQVATPSLWQVFLNPTGYVFQSLPLANNVILPGVTMAAVQRVAPAATTVVLPSLTSQFLSQKDIALVDYSTGIVAGATHTITVQPVGAGVTIMQQAAWSMLSTADSLASASLRACPDLNAWIIAP